ncbi:MAG: hypothetical protein R3A52_06005 [Polyangiales bacterium]
MEDALADAWVALACRADGAACAEGEGERALTRAAEVVPAAPVTLRARASREADPAAAEALLAEAALRDPGSQWDDRLRRRLAASEGRARTP